MDSGVYKNIKYVFFTWVFGNVRSVRYNETRVLCCVVFVLVPVELVCLEWLSGWLYVLYRLCVCV